MDNSYELNLPPDYKHYDTGIDDPISNGEESTEANPGEHQERSNDNPGDLGD